MAKKRVKDLMLPPGTYTARLLGHSLNNKGQLELTYQLNDPKKTKVKESIPAEGHTKFFVANSRLGIYTSIGADNMHHASNKCTKLFGPNGWSFLRSEYNHSPSLNGYEAKPYKEFKELINTLAI